MVSPSKVLSVIIGIGSLAVVASLQAAPAPDQGGASTGVRVVPPCVAANVPMYRGPHHPCVRGQVVPPCAAGMPGPGHHRGFHHGPRQFQGPKGFRQVVPFEDRLTYLRGTLQPTDSQIAQWNSYEQALTAAHSVKKNFPPAGPLATQRQKLEARVALKKAEAEALENVAKARDELVKVLTPEQIFVLEKMESRPHRFGPAGRHFGKHQRFANVQTNTAEKL